MGVSLKRTRGAARVEVRGSASVRDVAALRETLLELAGEGRRIVVDLGEVTSCDAAFAQLLVSAGTTYEERSLALEVIDPGDCVNAAFPATRAGATWVRA